MKLKSSDVNVARLDKCARCGNDHEHLVFQELTRKIDDMTHFSMCPGLGEPILMRVSVCLEYYPDA